MADKDVVRHAHRTRSVELGPAARKLDPRPFALGLARIAAATLEDDGELKQLNRSWLERHLFAPATHGTIQPEIEET